MNTKQNPSNKIATCIFKLTPLLFAAGCSGDPVPVLPQSGESPQSYSVVRRNEVLSKYPCFDEAREHFLELQRKNMVPGLNSGDRVHILFSVERIHPDLLDQKRLPYVPLTVSLDDGETIFQYIFVRGQAVGNWNLTSSWKISPDGTLIEL